jgi:hypothetical protein
VRRDRSQRDRSQVTGDAVAAAAWMEAHIADSAPLVTSLALESCPQYTRLDRSITRFRELTAFGRRMWYARKDLLWPDVSSSVAPCCS